MTSAFYRPRVILSVCIALLLWSLALPAFAAPEETKRSEITNAAINTTAVHAGDKGTFAVVLDIKKGFHAQSRKPAQEFLIKFDARLEENPAFKFGEPIYPAGTEEQSPVLGKLSVYSGKVTIRVPFEVKADVKPGDLTIKGKLHYQICDDNVCYRPDDAKFEIPVKVVAPGEKVEPNEAELFAEPKESAAAPAVRPAVKIFGRELNDRAYLLAFVAAFVVGIVFNIVPCVLPVLPLKAIGFYEVSQHNRAKCLAFGAVFSLGVIASFAVLGLLVVVLHVFKWGELFSNNWFLGALVSILVLMAAGMFGLFGVNVPSWLYAVSPRHDTYVGNFLFGILTAALSTPCTFGMFVGLLAWAAAQPSAIGMALMITVGAGMASPYFVLSAFPEVARKFPRTGRWSELVKQLMGFLLLGVAVYFAKPWIEQFIKPEAFWWSLFGVVAAGALFLVIRTIQFSPNATPRLVSAVLAIVVVGAAAVGVRYLTYKPYNWQPYSAGALVEARNTGEPVLVEFTASWCTNCHTLEALVINRGSVVDAVKEHRVQMIKADLSREDAPGWALLKELKEEGVPLTVLYSPATTDPIRLTGIYSPEDLRSAIAKAATRTVAAR